MNGQVFWLIAILSSVAVYIGLSLLGGRREYDMDRLLHRGRYAVDGDGSGKGNAAACDGTADPERDEELLSKVIALLRQCPGEDRVTLVINTRGGTRAEFDLPALRVSFTGELERQLAAVLTGST